MTSALVRDPLADHLLTPQNAALLLIDYQPAQLAAVRSMDHALLLKSAVSTVRTIKTFGVPTQEDALAIAEKWRPYRSPATSYLFSAAFEPAEAPPVARHRNG
jgi:hypothetical protein